MLKPLREVTGASSEKLVTSLSFFLRPRFSLSPAPFRGSLFPTPLSVEPDY